MPKITNIYRTSFSDIDNLYKVVKDSLNETGASNIKEEGNENVKYLEGVVPSTWGWGGMKINISVKNSDNTSELVIIGYIAQLATFPLKNVMKKLFSLISNKLNTKYNATFESTTSKNSIKLTPTDRKVIIIVLSAVAIDVLGSAVFGRFFHSFIFISILILGYYLGSKYLYKK